MKLFGSRQSKSAPSGEQKVKSTWFHMPRWAVVCGAAAFLSVVGAVVVKTIYVQPPPVIEAPLPVATTPPPVDPSGSPSPDEDENTAPPGHWESIGRKESVYTVLIVGRDGTSNTDTIMVAALDAQNHTLNVMSIPRDTQVNVSRGIKKINAAWAYGGIDQLKEELSTLIGFVPDVYALVELKAFVSLVDAIGGVDFDVPMDMKYRDPDQNLYIDLQKGYQHLDGDKAIQLVRYRNNNRKTQGYKLGDTGRVALHHDFLKAVVKQTLQLGNLFKIGEFISIVDENLESDLDIGQMLWFGQQLMKLSDGNVSFHMLPVDIGAQYRRGDYALVKQDEALELINETINPYLVPRTEDDLDISRLVDYWG